MLHHRVGAAAATALDDDGVAAGGITRADVGRVDEVQPAGVGVIDGVVAGVAVDVRAGGKAERIAQRERAQAGVIPTHQIPVEARYGVKIHAAKEHTVRVAGRRAGVGPRGVVGRHLAVRVVDVPLDDVAGGVGQGRHVVVGVGEIVNPVSGRKVAVHVGVAQDGRIDVPGRPDVLKVRVRDSGSCGEEAPSRVSTTCTPA